MTQETHTPQRSKRDDAINNLHAYLMGCLAGILGPHQDKLVGNAFERMREVAETCYAIVKRAEGFDVPFKVEIGEDGE